jgi:phosphomannomutase/phosphoglucomutase
MLKATIFREYDIRGVAETELLSPDVADLGRALGTYLRRSAGPKVNLGRDCRLSSPRLHDALLEGLMSAGCDVTDVGVGPTPLFVLLGGTHQSRRCRDDHRKPQSRRVQRLQDRLRIGHIAWRRDSTGSPPHRNPRISRLARAPIASSNVTAEYLDTVVPQFNFARRVKVVLDAGNGTAGPVAHRLFERLNCEVTELYFEMDGRFRIITRSDRARNLKKPQRHGSLRTVRIWGSRSTATPIASARSTKMAT